MPYFSLEMFLTNVKSTQGNLLELDLYSNGLYGPTLESDHSEYVLMGICGNHFEICPVNRSHRVQEVGYEQGERYDFCFYLGKKCAETG